MSVEPILDREVPQEIAKISSDVRYLYIVGLEHEASDQLSDGELFVDSVVKKLISACGTSVLDAPDHPTGPLLIDEKLDFSIFENPN